MSKNKTIFKPKRRKEGLVLVKGNIVLDSKTGEQGVLVGYERGGSVRVLLERGTFLITRVEDIYLLHKWNEPTAKLFQKRMLDYWNSQRDPSDGLIKMEDLIHP